MNGLSITNDSFEGQSGGEEVSKDVLGPGVYAERGSCLAAGFKELQLYGSPL